MSSTGPFARKRPPGHYVHQRGLARAVRTDDGDELGRADAQVDGVQDPLRSPARLPVPHIVAGAPYQQLGIADAPSRRKRGAVERQFERADIDAVPRNQRARAVQPRAVDVGTVCATKVAQHDGFVRHLEGRVTARDIRMVEHDLPWHRLTANGQTVAERYAVKCRIDRTLV